MSRFHPSKFNRRSLRLKGFDYTTPAGYFVTIVAQHRQHRFSVVRRNKIQLKPAGEMVLEVWNNLPFRYPGLDVDAFVIMPNHVHGIIVLTSDAVIAQNAVGVAPRGYPPSPRDHSHSRIGKTPNGNDIGWPNVKRGGTGASPYGREPGRNVEPRLNGGVRLSLPDAVHRFKSLTTNRYACGVIESHWPPFDRRLWQRNYYDHIVRDENDLARIRQYIRENPENWCLDRELGFWEATEKAQCNAPLR